MALSRASHSSPSIGSTAKRREPINLGILGKIFVLPLLFLAALVSIPITPVLRSVQKRRDEKFKKRMREAGRVVSWASAEIQKAAGNGTFVLDGETIKGPWHVWWTPDQIAKTSPFPFPVREDEVINPEFEPFRQWCYRNYLNSTSGKAFLVEPVETSVFERLFHEHECLKVLRVTSMRKK